MPTLKESGEKKMNRKGSVRIVVVGIIVLLVGVAGYFVLLRKPATPPVKNAQTTTTDSLIAVSYQDDAGHFQVFAVSPDGTTRKQLTHDDNGNIMPKWSPDGKKIAYVAQSEIKNGAVIHVMDADGANNTTVTEKESGTMSIVPDWSPDGQRIAYASGVVTGDPTKQMKAVAGDPMAVFKLKIWVMDADGTNKNQITSGGSSDVVPSWSPDGKNIVFTSDRDGGIFQIWRMNADGMDPVRLTQTSYDGTIGAPIEQKVPAWSPNGKYIAYWNGVEMFQLSEDVRKGTGQPTARDRSIMATWHIWVMNADGTDQRMLTQGDDPAWSPDSKMVFHPTLPIYGTTPEPIGVGATNIDGTNRHILFTVSGGGPMRYSWRPTSNADGSTPSGPTDASAYVKERGLLVMNDGTMREQLNQKGYPVTHVSIFTVRADGTGKTMLTGPNNQHPSWTPDGKIIFVSDRSGSPQVWIMDADGSNAKQVGDLEVGPILQPQLAKNGLIAFWANNGIWVIHKDGSGLRQLVVNGGAPSLALSGTWLTYTVPTHVLDGIHNEIFRINTDGTGTKQLTFTGDPDYPDANASAISPDETTVAIYTGKESDPGAAGFTQDIITYGYRNVGVIPADGGPRRLLTACKPVTTQQELQDRGPDVCIVADDPAWSTDGKWIVYSWGGKNGGETWMMDPNGENNQRLYPAGRGMGRVPLLIQEQ
ncbi:MAG: hypothetical protein A3C93_06100 [Candidatus Lloydbacteria bacterium RIFCSPHIGHO2_02_FULL_54_17]|uniref:DUF5050 domain-containing protein n=1 Tax=Candidatus Lloydbacteria bacterium RIFCSPHIGHO2_02_FULL_54_17 TaxID=1798664 RepID=A0A1G2DI64_9BACT|nr:MAG: hypothetical protein A2762_00835 [Candidatus Lloydbacteria bacterium RIFCSPHIGHO2_01_FULL_54_11]OGZ12651.1 MAG: hypothetical protein A3C93_06100 [Candidatus Lloydbacteria bacterium RIFCSPHIGHO2_02_FULL_54_17]OGZ13503.1 MAG: hypothetical protein A2948_04765 [Candidatus Lloydbacteria bacterium RIFCSPLOWO2_01_FULL_54_18]OGZ16175.1 MAG: hypothetical protein A3H76_03600 [Candidatus Lloydbacteria bacterium RIFCSPLOWO2_02_FULL_54_12]